MMSIARVLAAALALAAPLAAAAEPDAARSVENFADLADLSLASPVVAQAVVSAADKVDASRATGLAAGHRRFLVEADITALLRSQQVVAGRIRYLWDAPLDARGKAPRIKKASVLLFLAPAARPGEYRLTNAQAQIAATPVALAKVRSILAEARRPEMQGLRVTGVGTAFHVLGSLPGESESQIFLTTADNRPVSLVVLSRPGQARSYSVATGDIIDDSAKSVKPETLLWYELACRLPGALPAAAAAGLDDRAREAAEDDYRFVLGQLGPCARTLG